MEDIKAYAQVMFAMFRIGLKRELLQPSLLISQSIFLTVLLFIFSSLWHTIFANNFSEGVKAGDFVWYILVTELVTLTSPRLFREMQEEILSGDVLQRLLKPFPYPLLFIGEGCGIIFVRFIFMGALGFILAYFFTGGFPHDMSGLLTALALYPLAALALLLFSTAIGLLSGWLGDVLPLYWVFTKLMYVLGGLYLPLYIYPQWMQGIAICTPFYAMMYGIARHVIQPESSSAIISLMLLLFWCTAIGLLVAFLYRRLTKNITVSG